MVKKFVSYVIDYEPDPKPEDTQRLWKGISRHAKLKKNHEPGVPFAFLVKNETDQIKGGCSGYIFYGCLYVDLLWVDEQLRGQKFGIRLMEASENLAVKHKCHFIAVNTMDFEALDFYRKLGFYVEFERKGFSKESIMYFLRKDLKTI